MGDAEVVILVPTLCIEADTSVSIRLVTIMTTSICLSPSARRKDSIVCVVVSKASVAMARASF